jgi:predicted GH43/DUF377 family glycosyl hydrolase
MSLVRHPKNPIVTRRDIPDIPPLLVDPTSVFNPGAAKFGGSLFLLLRVQSRSRETFFLVAESHDGVDFDVRPEIVAFKGFEGIRQKIYHAYDPRITPLEGFAYIMFAIDVDPGCRLGLARTLDFQNFDFLGIVSDEDSRNGVLFSEKISGRYLRLDRPNVCRRENGTRTGSTIWLSESKDLIRWKPVAPVMDGRNHYWDEWIGSGPPPLKTRQGWVHIYHGIATHFGSANICQAGVVLLDLHDPSRVIGRSRTNILEPREPYELVGQVPNVVFPSGMVAERTDDEGFAHPESAVKIYYGAADTVVGLAETTVKSLLAAAAESPL